MSRLSLRIKCASSVISNIPAITTALLKNASFSLELHVGRQESAQQTRTPYRGPQSPTDDLDQKGFTTI